MDDPKVIFNFFEKEIDEVLSLASKLEFDSTQVLHQHVISLYGSIIELSSSIKVLYQSDHFTAIPVLLRTILEAFVDLCNLCQDPKYGYSLIMNSQHESLRFLKAAQNDQNVYANMIAQDPNIDEQIASFEAKIDVLKKNGNKRLKVRERFEKADMGDEYQTIYNMLCTASHNDIRALRTRHLVISGESFSLEIFKEEDTQNMYESLGIASELLWRATNDIHGLLNSGKDKEIQSLRDDLNKIRGDA